MVPTFVITLCKLWQFSFVFPDRISISKVFAEILLNFSTICIELFKRISCNLQDLSL